MLLRVEDRRTWDESESALDREVVHEAGPVGSMDKPGYLEGLAVLVEAGV
jgi:hypothetical protein